jgi:hypothetical protein
MKFNPCAAFLPHNRFRKHFRRKRRQIHRPEVARGQCEIVSPSYMVCGTHACQSILRHLRDLVRLLFAQPFVATTPMTVLLIEVVGGFTRPA